MIRPILQAGESTRSPLIVQVAQVEFQWYQLSIEEFARQFGCNLKRYTQPSGRIASGPIRQILA